MAPRLHRVLNGSVTPQSQTRTRQSFPLPSWDSSDAGGVASNARIPHLPETLIHRLTPLSTAPVDACSEIRTSREGASSRVRAGGDAQLSVRIGAKSRTIAPRACLAPITQVRVATRCTEA